MINIPFDNNSFIIDYFVHGGNFSSSDSKRIFSELQTLQNWLDVEVALALAQAELNLIPQAAAAEIKSKALIENFDMQSMRDATVKTKHSLMPLINQLENMCSPETATFIHCGATTQDIQDTALALQLREVLDSVRNSTVKTISKLAPIARANEHTLMTGRTHSMTASPITFGLKVASWIDELIRHLERIEQARSRICVAQMFGSVGTMASFKGQGIEVLKHFAARLDLGVPDACWHVSRDRIAEFSTILASITATLARVADELRTLNRPEIREIEMGFQVGEIGSSCMPHKRNPEDAEQIVVLARLSRAQVPLSLEAMILEHERDYRGTRMEWPLVASVSHYAMAALNIFDDMISRLTVNSDRMERNALMNSQFLGVENLMMRLTEKIGRKDAYAISYQIANEALDLNINIKDYVLSSKKIGEFFSESEIAEIFDPTRFVGSVSEIVDRVLQKADRYVKPETTVDVKPVHLLAG